MKFDKIHIPAELIERAKWCCWKYQERNGRKTKCPHNPNTGGMAKSNDASTFTDFQTAFNALDSGSYNGLGVGIFPPLSAIDIDDCIENGELSKMAADIIETMHSYTEISPSGRGIRIFFTINDDFVYDKQRFYIMNQKCGLEIYVSGSTQKFCTITGNRLNDFPLSDRTEAVTTVLEKYMRRKSADVPALPATGFQLDFSENNLTADAIIKKAENAHNGAKFRRLFSGDFSEYGSQSEADASLCAMLAYYTGDFGLIDEIFRRSGLMRDKWDRVQSGSTYGRITVENAISFSKQKTEFTPNERKSFAINKTLHLDTELIERLANLNPLKYHHSDRGTSSLFADLFRDTLRYNVTSGSWMYFNGAVWKNDEGAVIANQYAKKTFDSLMHFSSSIEDERQQSDFREFYSKLGSKNKRDTLLKDARDCMSVDASELDADTNLLNLQNGTLELDSLTFREHRADDLLSKVCGSEYHPEIVSEEWERFIKQVIPNDIDKLEFLQKAVGHSLLGKPLEKFFILYGRTTRNGKSTLLETISAALGDYARGCEPETLSQRKNRDSRAPSEDVARLAGCRFLRVSEPPQSMVFDVALLKKLTGGDAVTARFLNQGSFEFIPQFSLFMNTNYLPRVLDDTLFSSGRVNVIEFSRHFSEKEQDTTLKSRLKSLENLSGVMNWMIGGLRMYREQGFEIPHTVELETSDYKRISDKLNDFVDECLEPSNGVAITAKAVYARYKEWCNSCGYACEGKQKFMDKLRTRGMLADTGTIDGKTVRNVVNGYSIYSEYLDILT